MIAAKKELWRELNELNEQILRLVKTNAERQEEIDRLRAETEQMKQQNEVWSVDVFTYCCGNMWDRLSPQNGLMDSLRRELDSAKEEENQTMQLLSDKLDQLEMTKRVRRSQEIIIIIIIIYLHSKQKWTVKYAMFRTERLTVLAVTTARRYRIVTIKTQL